MSTADLEENRSMFDLIENKVKELKADWIRFDEKNNKAAGTRVRKGINELRKLGQEMRKYVQEKKNQS